MATAFSCQKSATANSVVNTKVRILNSSCFLSISHVPIGAIGRYRACPRSTLLPRPRSVHRPAVARQWRARRRRAADSVVPEHVREPRPRPGAAVRCVALAAERAGIGAAGNDGPARQWRATCPAQKRAVLLQSNFHGATGLRAHEFSGRSLVNRNLQIARASRDDKQLSSTALRICFGARGNALAVNLDHETPRLGEIARLEVGHKVSETVDVQHTAAPAVAARRPGCGEWRPGIIHNLFAHFRWGGASCQMRGCGREDVTTVKGVADRLEKDPAVRDCPHLVFLARVDHFQNPVVWRHKILSSGFHQDGPAGGAYARVDDHNVDRVTATAPRQSGFNPRRPRSRELAHFDTMTLKLVSHTFCCP